MSRKLNTWIWEQDKDFTWKLVLHIGRNASPASGSVQICSTLPPELLPDREGEILPETEDERVPELLCDTDEEMVPETEEEMVSETDAEMVPETEAEMLPEIEAELVPAQALAPSASVAEPPVLEEEPVWRSEAERIRYYKCLALWYPKLLDLI